MEGIIPYVIDPNAPQPVLPEMVTSPDGLLKAVLDKDNAGALLRANFQTTPPVPEVAAVPERVLATNLSPHPFWAGDDNPVTTAPSNRWTAYVNAAAAYDIGPGSVSGGRTLARVTNRDTVGVVPNAGLEDGTLVPFDSSGGAVNTGSGTVAISTVRAHSGTRSIVVTNTGDGVTYKNSNSIGPLSTLFPGVVVGDTIQVSAWVYIPAGGTPYSTALAITGSAFAASGSNPAPSVRDQWVKVTASQTVTTVTGNANIRIYGGTVNGTTLFYDDLEIRKISNNTRLGVRNVNVSGAALSLQAGLTYWAVADVQVSATATTNTGTAKFTLQALFRDDPNNDSAAADVLLNSAGTVNSAFVMDKGSIQRVWWKIKVHAGRTVTGVYVTGIGTTPQPDGAFIEAGRWHFAEVQPGETQPPAAYFDGDTPAESATLKYRYTGTAAASPSQRYVPAIPFSPYVPPTWPSNLARVRFYREDGTPVRSGSPAAVPGGIAYAYDREAPLGVVTSWYAVPEFADGTVGPKTQLVSLQIPAPSLFDTRGVWLKSVSNPNLAVRVTATDVPELSYEARQAFSAVAGASYPAASFDEWGAATGSWSFYVPTDEARKALQAVLSSGVVLVQTHPDAAIEDMYVLFGGITRSRPGSVRQQDQLLTADFTEVGPLPAEGSALFIPSHSWADFLGRSGTWGNALDVFGTWGGALTI